MLYIFRYGEIALKGANLSFYKKILKQNIANALVYRLKLNNLQQDVDFKIYFKARDGLINLVCTKNKKHIIEIFDQVLLKTPGIAWFGKLQEEFDINILIDPSKENSLLKILAPYFPFDNLDVKRVDKNIKTTSQNVWIKLRKMSHNYMKNSTSQKQDVQDNKYILILDQTAKLYRVYKGQAGLPVSSSGHGIVLFSGGIDSAVAAYLMAKRGVNFDLLHFSPYDANTIKQSKIYKMYQILKLYNPYTRLYIANIPFFKKLLMQEDLQNNKQHKHLYNSMIQFKRIILKTSAAFGEKIYKGQYLIITGDSLGQVSSQTISNLIGTTQVLCNDFVCSKQNKALLIRPLIGMDKQEIINIAQQIGTYNFSIMPYIDCCSRLAKNSKTTTNILKIQKQEQSINLQEIIADSLNTLVQVK